MNEHPYYDSFTLKEHENDGSYWYVYEYRQNDEGHYNKADLKHQKWELGKLRKNTSIATPKPEQTPDFKPSDPEFVRPMSKLLSGLAGLYNTQLSTPCSVKCKITMCFQLFCSSVSKHLIVPDPIFLSSNSS
jgi:hypothetical protein